MYSKWRLYLLPLALIALAVAVAFLRRDEGSDTEWDVNATDHYRDVGAEGGVGRPSDTKRPRGDSVPRKTPREGKNDDETAYNFGIYISEKRLPLADLLEELQGIRGRVTDKIFYRVMEMLGASSHYPPEDKAAAFNKFLPVLPVNDAPSVYPAYQTALGKWGKTPENKEAIFRFIGLLDSPEMRENLAISYYMESCQSKEDLADLVQELADTSHPSFLGDDAQRRVLSLKQIIDSMALSKALTKEEASGLISGLEVDAAFKEILLRRISGQDLSGE